MKFHRLGKTDLEVSAISLGTVSLGVPYGIPVSRNFGTPAPEYSARLLNAAADAGINLFDTAPTYGSSEQILGKVFSNRSDLYIATKVSIPKHESVRERRNAIMSSLQRSLRNLRRDVLDIVQIHNARGEDIQKGEITDLLLQAKQEGLVRFLGASVYGKEAAAKVMEDDCLDVLQMAYSILDQRLSLSGFTLADTGQTAILVRSALLKGVLSEKAKALPDELKILRDAAQKVRRALNCSWQQLPEVALRFCLSNQQVSSVLVGARTLEELQQGITAWRTGPLSERFLGAAPALALNEEIWVNPSCWPIP